MNMFLPSFKETVMQINHPFLVVIRLIRMTYVHIIYQYRCCFVPFWKWVIFPIILEVDMLLCRRVSKAKLLLV